MIKVPPPAIFLATRKETRKTHAPLMCVQNQGICAVERISQRRGRFLFWRELLPPVLMLSLQNTKARVRRKKTCPFPPVSTNRCMPIIQTKRCWCLRENVSEKLLFLSISRVLRLPFLEEQGKKKEARIQFLRIVHSLGTPKTHSQPFQGTSVYLLRRNRSRKTLSRSILAPVYS